jgi:single-stranded-DNA-specific exonuclease
MAAGITIRRERLAEFRAYLEAALGEAVEAARRDEALLIDGALSAAAANLEFCGSIMRAGPFGAGNPDPVFALPAHTIAFADVVGGQHIRARLRSPDGAFVNAVAFRAAQTDLGRALIEGRGAAMHIAGQLSVDRWQGAERVQMRLLDVAQAG